MHDFEYQITTSIFVIRYSIFELPPFFVFIRSKTFFGVRKFTEYQVFNIKVLMHGFEYQITNSIFVVRYSIFELPLFFVLLGSKTVFGIRKVTEYQVFNIQTSF